jgi:hypothetical protein
VSGLRGVLADRTPWTPEQDRVLVAAYAAGGVKAAAAALPERSESSIFHRARRLRVTRRRRWTPGDDLTLEVLWGEGLRLSGIAKHLGRTTLTVYWRAQKIGLPLGVPDGFEHLSTAAKRAGFAPEALRLMLRRAGKKVRSSLSRPTGPRSWHRQIVDSRDVDEVVARHLATETPAAAARRLGINPDRLRARLAQIGVQNAPGTRAHLRVTDEQLAAANAIAQFWKRTRSARARRAA